MISSKEKVSDIENLMLKKFDSSKFHLITKNTAIYYSDKSDYTVEHGYIEKEVKIFGLSMNSGPSGQA